ncbi:hypothetical protein [Leptolyngbya sp. 7M]|uniref:hypothetical protein n=1 Tax=Leptolyngbya sp. 7M TaxID=2812896 RepID=UPI001B8AAFC9|nr:hypothetical protein [Leptolyngbya sp. 7M]QYO63754.1 hypothetical protein JVX88_28530 [Leptolyngbya sp. 7M]
MQGEPLIAFLDLAWNSQDGTQLDATVEALQTLVQGFANPTAVLKFSQTILQLADTPVDLRPKQLPRLPQVDPTLTIRTPPGNPFYRLFGIFPGDTPRFIQHYYEGGGAPVDLADWGLLETYRTAPDVRRGASKLKYDAINEINRQASTGTPTQVTGESTDSVNAEPVIFSMGKSILKLEYTATIDRSNPHIGRYASHPSYVSYPYTLELRYSVNDRFVDALDELNLIPGNQELPGNPTPYALTASWTITDTGWTSPAYN